MAKELTLQDLEPGLAINEHALEQDCARHPDLFYRVSKRLAYEISLRDAAKENLANVEAEVDARIRENAAEDDDDKKKKVTEKEIESLKRLDPSVDKVRKQYLAYSHSVAQWTALKDSFLQRSYMLKSLGELYVANYYSDTSTGGAVASAQAARAKKELQEERVRRNR